MLSRKSIAWALYDWANSAFALSVLAALFPIFLGTYWSADDSGADVTARLGLITAAAAFIVSVMAPVLGAIADAGGWLTNGHPILADLPEQGVAGVVSPDRFTTEDDFDVDTAIDGLAKGISKGFAIVVVEARPDFGPRHSPLDEREHGILQLLVAGVTGLVEDRPQTHLRFEHDLVRLVGLLGVWALLDSHVIED